MESTPLNAPDPYWISLESVSFRIERMPVKAELPISVSFSGSAFSRIDVH